MLYACDCDSGRTIDARTAPQRRSRLRRFLPGPWPRAEAAGTTALRFRVPEDGTTVVHDLVRGDVEFANATIEDFVVVKSNGDPLFVLAVVVDDLDMAITDVVRAEEHLPTTPKAVLIWRALGGSVRAAASTPTSRSS